MALLAKIPIRWSPFTITTASRGTTSGTCGSPGGLQPAATSLGLSQRPFPSLDLPGWEQLTFGIAIGVHGVVGKADFVSLASGVDDKICRKAKEENSAVSCEDKTAAHGTEGLEAAHPPAPATP